MRNEPVNVSTMISPNSTSELRSIGSSCEAPDLTPLSDTRFDFCCRSAVLKWKEEVEQNCLTRVNGNRGRRARLRAVIGAHWAALSGGPDRMLLHCSHVGVDFRAVAGLDPQK